MLLKYGVLNFFCFNEGFEIDFRLNKNCPKEISKGNPNTNIICVKGANASGKTNALKALSTFADLCCNSFDRKPDAKLAVVPFFYNKNPIEFFIDFISDDIEYRYEIATTIDTILSEKIFRKKQKSILILEREHDKITHSIKEFDLLKTIKLRSNASFISISNQHVIPSIEPIYGFFHSVISNINILGLNNLSTTADSLSVISEFYYHNESFFKFVKEIMCKCDLGVDDIEILKKEDVKGGDIYLPVYMHKSKGKSYSISHYTQSSGTQSLFLNLFRYRMVLQMGGVLVLDEFDINLHPHILPVLLDLFIDPKKNPHNSQLIFTTHDDAVLELMGKYRTVLINKEDNESYAYRLDEIPGDMIRNDRLIAPIYNAGKIGGVPIIKE